MLDTEAARAFLEQSRSRFVRIALDWLVTREDPVDLLFVLSREVGQALGPWDTFRTCALLGLTPAKAVRELGLDVLAEPVGPSPGESSRRRARVPPVSEAFAIAHAKRAWPNEAAPFADAVRIALEQAAPDVVHPGLLAAARVALSGTDATAIGFDDAVRALEDALSGDAIAIAAELLEMRALVGDRLPERLLEALGATVRASQQPDGGLLTSGDARRWRELATLRALGAARDAI